MEHPVGETPWKYTITGDAGEIFYLKNFYGVSNVVFLRQHLKAYKKIEFFIS
jgi:hypothetical protein